MCRLDIFGNKVFEAFKSRVSITNFDNGFRNGKASFVVGNVQKSDAGNFQCESKFEGLQPCGSATLVVAGQWALAGWLVGWLVGWLAG